MAAPPSKNATASFWLSDNKYNTICIGQCPEKDIDIAIIGAGMSGISIAYHLTQLYNSKKYFNTNIHVLVIDSRGVCGGATGRNGGILRPKPTYTLNNILMLNNILQNYDLKAAIDFYKFELQTYNEIISFLKKHNINYEKQTKVQIVDSIKDATKAKDNYNKFKKYFKEHNDTFTLEYVADVNNKNYRIITNKSLVFWPTQFVHKMLDIIIENTNNDRNPIKFYLQTQKTVTNVIHSNGKWHLYTDNDTIIQSKVVIYATNAYTPYLLNEYKNKIIAIKNQLLITKPISKNKVFDSKILGNSYDYCYQRDIDNRILIGGGRNSGYVGTDKWIGDANDSEINESVSKYFTDCLKNKYGCNNHIEIDMEWQGILTATKDKLPYVGPIVNKPNAYICAGFNGAGLKLIFGVSKAIASMIVGDDMNLKHFPDILLPKRNGKLSKSKL